MELVSTLSIHCLFYLKKQFLNVLTADPSNNFNEAVDELFQQLFVDGCMEMMSKLLLIAYSAVKKNTDLQFLYCRSILKLQ